MATDLEKFVEAKGRDDKIKEVRAKIDELGIEYDRENITLKQLTDRLHEFLLENHSRGRNTVLLIDEAQHLKFDVLEQIRLLTNLETNTRKLLQIVLVGVTTSHEEFHETNKYKIQSIYDNFFNPRGKHFKALIA